LTWVAQDPAYNRLKERLIASTGLAFYADRDALLTELIHARLKKLRLRDCSAYLNLLARGQEGSDERELFIGQLTIGETYFFRDQGQFDAIRDVILPDILERNQASKEVRIWSAGCSTGAEPYSLAILLERELASRMDGWQIHIHASDLNRSYLAQAAVGKFRPWALRSISEEIKRDCFTQDGRVWTIHPRYKQRISFHQMNLVDSEFSAPLAEGAHFDLILCRNVMMYFTPKVNRRLVAQFHRSLEEGGWLLVGASEYNLENYTAFQTVNTPEAKLYQKAAPVRIATTPEPPSQRLENATPTPAEPGISSSDAVSDIDGLRELAELADRGEWEGAGEFAQRLLTKNRLHPAIHFYQALIFENLGATAPSEQSLRHAIYLDRTFAMAHYHLGLVLKRDMKIRDASRSFENVLKVLTSVPDDTILTAGRGVTAAALREQANMQLKHSTSRSAKV
jgi:chemotaxis protein methyltransferase CheR